MEFQHEKVLGCFSLLQFCCYIVTKWFSYSKLTPIFLNKISFSEIVMHLYILFLYSPIQLP